MRISTLNIIVLLQCVALAASTAAALDETAANDEVGFLRGELASSDNFAQCGDCFCVPSEGEECPVADRPPTDWSDLIPTLKAFELQAPNKLLCDPYTNNLCQPPSSEEDGVCVVEIEASSNTCPTGYKYTLKTYQKTVEQALADGQYVTHSNPCGVCSSLQDLAAYMEQGAQLRSAAQSCGIKGIVNEKWGISCFMKLGFTEPCARIWQYNAQNTRAKCKWACWKFYLLNKDPNEGPNCDLADCIQCDETESGPLFDQFAGRTRRNSGLLSNIVRPCSQQVLALKQPNPCEIV